MMKILKDYKKIAKSMLIESAWDRKFGEPLPTLEDTTKKHQTDAYRPGQPEHKPGDVWQTDNGWAAWRPGDKTAEYGIEDKENAVKWAKGKIDPDSTSGSDDEKEPAGKLGGGDFDRGSDDDEYAISGTDSDDPAGGKGDAWMTGHDDDEAKAQAMKDMEDEFDIDFDESVNETLPNRVWMDLRKKYSTNELKRFFKKESVNEGGMGVLSKDQADILQGLVMKHKNKNPKAIYNVVMKSPHFKGVDKKEMLGYIHGAIAFSKYMKI